MKSEILRLSIILLLISTVCAAQQKGRPARAEKHKPTGQIFVFHTDEFWLNLNHFLYVLGRSQNKTRDSLREAVSAAPADQKEGLATLGAAEQKTWEEIVTAYAAGISKKDLVFDAPLPAVTTALSKAGDARSLPSANIDADTAALLKRAAPIYRKVWWPKHHQANIAWRKSIQDLVDKHGAAVLAFITGAYQMEWSAKGFRVHLTAYSNWAGAYSTDGNLLVVSSLSPSIQGNYGLETIFHEGMHQWDDQVQLALTEQAKKISKPLKEDLSHAMIFFTAGEAMRHVLPEHVPYAEKFGVWRRGFEPFRIALEEFWRPYLEGKGTRDEAFAKLIERTAGDPGLK